MIRSGERLAPQTVSTPAFLAVRLTVISRDGRSHGIVLRTPQRYKLVVPAGGQRSVLIPGQRAAQYLIDVDGVARAALRVGGEPGP